MPEGHTIHRLAQDMARDLVGHVVEVSSPQGRFLDAGCVDGRKCVRTGAIGKHLLVSFEGNQTVHVHLGLFGKFRRRRTPARPPTPTTRMRLVGPKFTWDLTGPTACECLSRAALRELRLRIGADPLAHSADVGLAWQRVHASRRPIGALLLDQRIIAGVGNVYRAEILFLLGVHPLVLGGNITATMFDDLWKLASDLLARGVRDKRIVTVPHEGTARVPRQEALFVYKRKTCRRCGGAISRFVVGTRPIYACETCQIRPQ